MLEQIDEVCPEAPPFGEPGFAESIGPALTQALRDRGYDTLTPVQKQVLAPGLNGKDLRISSQTGSGKTVAIGLALRHTLEAKGANTSAAEAKGAKRAAPARSASPRAIVIVPTRELAKQVQLELAWLYGPLRVQVTSVTGGASYRDEQRALGRGPGVIVGTPGRLLDHLKQGAIETSSVGAVVLDEADQMLDLGFREELEAILGQMPEERQTHLVSATFPREVIALANRVQKGAIRVEGTPLGDANADIDHVVHLVEPRDRVAALINVLLFHPEDQALVFAKTRADVAAIASELLGAGFAAGALSGEMEQAARNRALSAFKSGQLRALVATDVAARGIDVQNIARVIQMDAPPNADAYTHRSGRTGRAGRKGTSQLLISKAALRRTEQVLQRAGVRHRIEAVPSANAIRRAQDERWFTELTKPLSEHASKRVQEQVARILEGGHTGVALARLLTQMQRVQGEPREIANVAVRPQGRPRHQQWVSFRISVGEAQGADARRLVAMLCRRGKLRGTDIGAIRVEQSFSIVDIATDVAAEFAEAMRRPDPRDPRVNVSLFTQKQSARPERAPAPKPYAKKHVAGGGGRGGGAGGKKPRTFRKPAVARAKQQPHESG